MTPRFFTRLGRGKDLGKTFLIPFRRETNQPPTPAVQTFTRAANGRARSANRARNKQARRSRRANR